MSQNITAYADALRDTGVISFVPHGNSMWPIIKNGKNTVIVEAKKERLVEGDVALYVREDGEYVLHRVYAVKEGGYVMRGDSQNYFENVEESAVLGVLIGLYYGKRYVDVSDSFYTKKVDKWFKHELLRKIRLKFFYLGVKIKAKLKRIFGK